MNTSETSFADLTLRGFIGSIAAKTPAPGGGAVASAVGAIAAALANMVVSYSIGKKNLASHDALHQSAAHRLTRAAEIMLTLADEDAAAYSLVNELAKLPETDSRRQAEYPEALLTAARIPLAVAAAAVDVLRLFHELSDKTNRYLRSDLAIAAVLADATVSASKWNVMINLPGLPPDEARAISDQLSHLLAESSRIRAEVEHACQV